ncbi:hypothetical protein A3K55_02015 [Candidatus Shapirobacteria bacterium RBG_13_44_7]|uniref:DinB-like domain-containing protein n=1 Tax=Candidatus Shapirobacteria bacterium RBG_13_44_7 TaxID=1802149 RepID=A0A1F7SJ76_9BACT|nr:MAG: hypothetical protein A3K55_02015 [Candidatus Shapirobacteria bacterium RBG_13_44_7]
MKVDNLKSLRKELIDTIDAFPVAKREEILFDKWSLKDIIAHLSGWNIFTTESIQKFKSGNLSLWGGKVCDFNQKSINHRQHFNWQQTYDEFINSSREMIQEYESLSPDLSNQKIWPDKNYTSAKFLKIDINHYQEHLEKIKEQL